MTVLCDYFALMSYYIAEKTSTLFMVNLDGFILTHTYEEVNIPKEKSWIAVCGILRSMKTVNLL